MRSLNTLQGLDVLTRFLGLLFAWTSLLIWIWFDLPEIRKLSSLLSGVAVVIVMVVYSLPPRFQHHNRIFSRICICTFVLCFASVCTLAITTLPKFGSDPLLIHATKPFGSSRVWAFIFWALMGVGAISGLVNFFLLQRRK